MAAQLAPGSATKYCHIAVSTDRTAEDPDKLGTMVFNGKRWVGHDLEKPIHTLKRKDVNKSKEGLPLASPTTKPARCPGCSNYRKRRSVGTDEDSSDEEMSDIVSSAQNTPIRHPPQLNPTQSAVAPTTTTVVTTYASPKRLRQTPSTPGSSSAQSRAQSPATGLISGLGRFESQPLERMEGVQDELVLHQEEKIGASEEVATTTPLDSSASVSEQTPQPMEPITQLTDQTPLNRRVVLPLQGSETPPSLPAYNPSVLTTPHPSQGLSGAGLANPMQPPVITGPGTPLQTSVGRPIPVTLNTAPAAVAAPVPLEQIMQEQQVQEQREAQELMVPQSFASTVMILVVDSVTKEC